MIKLGTYYSHLNTKQLRIPFHLLLLINIYFLCFLFPKSNWLLIHVRSRNALSKLVVSLRIVSLSPILKSYVIYAFLSSGVARSVEIVVSLGKIAYCQKMSLRNGKI